MTSITLIEAQRLSTKVLEAATALNVAISKANQACISVELETQEVSRVGYALPGIALCVRCSVNPAHLYIEPSQDGLVTGTMVGDALPNACAELKDVVQRRLYCNKDGVWFTESRVLFKEGKTSAWGLDCPNPVNYDRARAQAETDGIKLEPDYVEEVKIEPEQDRKAENLRYRIHSPYAGRHLIQESNTPLGTPMHWVQIGGFFKGATTARTWALEQGYHLIN